MNNRRWLESTWFIAITFIIFVYIQIIVMDTYGLWGFFGLVVIFTVVAMIDKEKKERQGTGKKSYRVEEKLAIDIKTYLIILSGKVIEGRNPDEVKSNMARLLKLPPSGIDKFFSGKPMVIKKVSDQETAQKYKVALEKAGAICLIKESVSVPAEVTAKSNEFQKETGTTADMLIGLAIISMVFAGAYVYLNGYTPAPATVSTGGRGQLDSNATICRTRAQYDDMVSFRIADDRTSFNAYYMAGKCRAAAGGETVTILEKTFDGTARVSMAGTIWWVSSSHIRK